MHHPHDSCFSFKTYGQLFVKPVDAGDAALLMVLRVDGATSHVDGSAY